MPDKNARYLKPDYRDHSISRYEKFLRDYDEVMSNRDEYALMYLLRAKEQSDAGSRLAAISSYTRAIDLKPNYVIAYRDRGNLKRDLGQNFDAIIDYDKAIAFDPNFALAYYDRGMAKLNLSCESEANTDFRMAMLLAREQNMDDLIAEINKVYTPQGDEDEGSSDRTRTS